ncbi:nuclear transport factor 2 family protein [Epibacterium ulvae]|uniref:nuclear transport factor 2 family protein n=1 Tax=Epibacterium ulvae TaxID=1156985 RepID=UPI001BFCB159|nr:nuclear transport factor 2 family protein [Epibacterium ulvae]MBT8153135.1 nuclear transport factor 2 family protein [Epibacterium ulvae]
MTQNRIDQIRELLKSIETGDPGPIAVVNEAQYIQHNPQTHEGSEGLASLFARLAKTEPRVNMVRGFEDGDYVFAQMEYDFSSRKICFEVFRFEDGQAVEHWDNIQDRLGPNLSGRDMVEGPVAVTDLHLTEENRRQARGFVQQVLIMRRFEALAGHMDANYIEHNPHLGDGIASLRAALSADHAGQPRITYQRLHRVLAQGDFVLTVSEGLRDGTQTAFYDLFRYEAGLIAEHWDTTETVAPQPEWKNTNGKF